MIAPDYRLPQYGLTVSQLETIARLRTMPAWQRRKIHKLMSGGPRGTFVYKYLAFDPANPLSLKKVQDLVVESKLYLSAPSEFNDPYDFRARIILSNDAAEHRAHFRNFARKSLESGDDPIPHIRGTSRKLDVLVRRAMDGLVANPNRVALAFNRVRDKNGISCFSEDPRGLLMWAHYAAGHTGLCLQFDVTQDPGVLMISHRVIYREELPTIVWPHMGDIVNEVILNKGKAWEAEKEVRHVSVKVVRDTLRFDGRALRAIIFGARFPSERMDDIQQIVRDRVNLGLHAPIFYQAQQKPAAYGIYLKRVPSGR